MDIGVFDRYKRLTDTQIHNRQILFEQYQSEYNRTGDKDILWFKMAPLIHDAVEASIMKLNNTGFILNYESKVEDAYLLIIARYIRRPDYNFKYLATLTYWASLYASRKTAAQDQDKIDLASSSYEKFMEESGNETYEMDFDFDNYIDLEELY